MDSSRLAVTCCASTVEPDETSPVCRWHTCTGSRAWRMAGLLVALAIRLDHGLQPPAVRASASGCGT